MLKKLMNNKRRNKKMQEAKNDFVRFNLSVL